MTTIFDGYFRDAFDDLLYQFGESVTYHFRDGTQVTRTAIVNRDPPAILDVEGNFVKPVVQIRMHNDADKGVLADSVDSGGDRVTVTDRAKSMENRQLYVFQLQSSDGGVCTIALR